MTLGGTRTEPMTPVEPAGADEDLLRRVGAGDERAFRELFARYAGVAHALAFRLVRQAQVSEEIVQEAFLACGGARSGTTGPEVRSAPG